MSRLDQFVQAAQRRVSEGHYDGSGKLAANGSLKAAIEASPANAIIAELKPASPSRGRLLPDGEAGRVLADYAAGQATGISVLTDGDFFGESVDLLVRAHTTGRPTLMKDFVIHEAQLDAAAAAGASAVLVIERVFDGRPQEREAIVQAAHDRGLEVLLEVHSAHDWATAQQSSADILGVNARDLETLQLDPAGARNLVAAMAAADSRPVLSLSGVRHRRDHRAAIQAGAAGSLVGTTLMLAQDPALQLQGLRRPLAKVCGITDHDDLAAVAAAGADLAGFIVGAPTSPRNLAIDDAAALIQAAHAAGIATVLVTPESDETRLRDWCQTATPRWLQSHANAPGNLPVRLILHAIAPNQTPPTTGGLVIDTPRNDGTTGGAGTTHDWTQTRTIVEADPTRMTLVAGGLNPDNAAAALTATQAWGADASSRLERAPGRKNHDAVHDFVRAVHRAQGC